MTADETEHAIADLKASLVKGAPTHPKGQEAARLMVIGMDLLCGLLLDVKAIADESRRQTKYVADYEAKKAAEAASDNPF